MPDTRSRSADIWHQTQYPAGSKPLPFVKDFALHSGGRLLPLVKDFALHSGGRLLPLVKDFALHSGGRLLPLVKDFALHSGAQPFFAGLVAIARGQTPDPIPNSAVKTLSADGTSSQDAEE